MHDILDHRVSMLRSIGKTGEHQHGRVGIVAQLCLFVGGYYVTRTTHDVVMAYWLGWCKGNFLSCLSWHRLRHQLAKPSLPQVPPSQVLPTIKAIFLMRKSSDSFLAIDGIVNIFGSLGIDQPVEFVAGAEF